MGSFLGTLPSGVKKAFLGNITGYFEFNLTKDIIEDGIFANVDGKITEVSGEMGFKMPFSFTDLCDSYSLKLISSEKERKRYFKTNTIENLTKQFENGVNPVVCRYWMKTLSGSERLCIETIYLLRDETDGDIHALVTFQDGTKFARERDEAVKRSEVYRTAVYSNAIGYFEANLTQDVLLTSIIEKVKKVPREVDDLLSLSDNSYSELYKAFMHKFVITNRDEFSKVFNRRFLLKKYDKGEYMPEITYWGNTITGQYKCIRLSCVLMKDERTNDILGFFVYKDVSKEERAKLEAETLNKVLGGLSEDFEAVFYVDLDSKIFKAFRISDNYKRQGIFPSSGKDFFAPLCRIVEDNVVEGDKVKTVEALSTERIKAELKDKKAYYVNCRVMVDDHMVYYQIKIVRLEGKKNTIIIGFHNADVETRREVEQRERLKEMMKSELMYKRAIISQAISYFTINFTEDEITSDIYENVEGVNVNVLEEVGLVSPAKFSAFARICLDNFVCESHDEYREFMKSSAMEEKFNRGELITELSCWVTARTGAKRCQRHIFYLSKDERTDDLVGLCVIQDITQNRIYADELSLSREELNEARKKAEAASAAKSTFLFNMSHDIRTPMNAIIGFTEIGKKKINDPLKVTDCFNKIDISSHHLLNLINDVLDMSRIESGKVVIDEVPCNLKKNVDEITTIIKSSADEKNIRFSFDYAEVRDADVNADELHLNQILLNVLSNAIKYTKPGGKVIYKVRQVESDMIGYGKYEFITIDNGIGMSEKYLNHIFEAFSRETSTTRSGVQGTGLGMAITKHLIDLMGGNIEVKSSLGQGTSVVITLSFKITQKSNYIEAMTEGNIGSGLVGRRVLLVEDNELNREIAKDILVDSGLIVDEADDGAVAVEKVRKSYAGYYDFILMDIQMPYMDGYTATYAIRSLPDNELSRIPIIAMTANAFEEDKKKAYEAGMDAHLSKPMKGKDLIDTLKRLS